MQQVAATTAPDIWPILWPVIIGGLLATLPSVVGQLLTHLLAQSSEKKARRRDRFQKIGEGLSSLEVWLNNRRSELAFAGPAVAEPDPLPSIMTLAMMDFPELLPALDLLEEKARDYTRWQIAAASKRLKGDFATINDGFDDAFRPFWGQFLAVQKELRAIAAGREFS
ncbi:hypothetical protein [Devosia sp.]|uniref:hypothetical protein n=1 Tax=Devosia sp. TaxID=1871048 RepID=UPI001A0DDCF2|nr:hypothetical protein [Devosia sp.]MBE0580816.1 hypothetical protein [Devosia sp.]